MKGMAAALVWLGAWPVLLLSLNDCQHVVPNVTSTTDGVHTTVIVTYPPQQDLLTQILSGALSGAKALLP